MFKQYHIYLIQSDEIKYNGAELTLSFQLNINDLIDFEGDTFVITNIEHRFSRGGDYKNTVVSVNRIR
jgi:hypothetical protein